MVTSNKRNVLTKENRTWVRKKRSKDLFIRNKTIKNNLLIVYTNAENRQKEKKKTDQKTTVTENEGRGLEGGGGGGNYPSI